MLVIGLMYIIYYNLTNGQMNLFHLVVTLSYSLLVVLKLGYYLSLDVRSIVFLNLLDYFKQYVKHFRGII